MFSDGESICSGDIISMIKEGLVSGTYVMVVIEGDDATVNKEYHEYINNYPPQGYGTKVTHMEQTAQGKKLTLERLASCD